MTVVLLAYPVSVGPACWVSSRWGRGKIVTKAYQPLAKVAFAKDDGLLASTFDWYSRLFADERFEWVGFVGPNRDGEWLWIDSNMNGPW